jgi:hypothetical protein
MDFALCYNKDHRISTFEDSEIFDGQGCQQEAVVLVVFIVR